MALPVLLTGFAQIRASVADYLFMETGSQIVQEEDWTMQPKQLKSSVESLKVALVQ